MKTKLSLSKLTALISKLALVLVIIAFFCPVTFNSERYENLISDAVEELAGNQMEYDEFILGFDDIKTGYSDFAELFAEYRTDYVAEVDETFYDEDYSVEGEDEDFGLDYDEYDDEDQFYEDWDAAWAAQWESEYAAASAEALENAWNDAWSEVWDEIETNDYWSNEITEYVEMDFDFVKDLNAKLVSTEFVNYDDFEDEDEYNEAAAEKFEEAFEAEMNAYYKKCLLNSLLLAWDSEVSDFYDISEELEPLEEELKTSVLTLDTDSEEFEIAWNGLMDRVFKFGIPSDINITIDEYIAEANALEEKDFGLNPEDYENEDDYIDDYAELYGEAFAERMAEYIQLEEKDFLTSGFGVIKQFKTANFVYVPALAMIIFIFAIIAIVTGISFFVVTLVNKKFKFQDESIIMDSSFMIVIVVSLFFLIMNKFSKIGEYETFLFSKEIRFGLYLALAGICISCVLYAVSMFLAFREMKADAVPGVIPESFGDRLKEELYVTFYPCTKVLSFVFKPVGRGLAFVLSPVADFLTIIMAKPLTCIIFWVIIMAIVIVPVFFSMK